MKRPSHRADPTAPMSEGNALRELMACAKLAAPNMSHKFKKELKVKLAVALRLDIEFNNGGVAPSKQECEVLIFKKAKTEEIVAVAKKFTEVARILWR